MRVRGIISVNEMGEESTINTFPIIQNTDIFIQAGGSSSFFVTFYRKHRY